MHVNILADIYSAVNSFQSSIFALFLLLLIAVALRNNRLHLNRRDLFEDRQARSTNCDDFLFNLPFFANYRKSYNLWVLAILQPFSKLVCVFSEHLHPALGHGLSIECPRRVSELAPESVGAVEVLMVLLAELGLVSRRNVLLLLKLVVTVGKGTLISEFTMTH